MASKLSINYEPCVVSFIDVLGFRSLLDHCNPSQIYNVLAVFEASTRPDAQEVDPPPQRGQRFQSKAFAYRLSDTIIRVRPYDTKYSDGALIDELHDLLLAQITLVANKILIRAGVTVGNAYVGVTGSGPVFGPAIVRAYEIESQEAIFPRVVVDDEAIEQHRVDTRLRREGHTVDYEFKTLQGLLGTGDDGTRYIDYLRAGLDFLSPGDHMQFLKQHAELIRGSRSIHNDRRTSRKFDWLARYHDRYISDRLMGSSEDVKDTSRLEALYIYPDDSMRPGG